MSQKKDKYPEQRIFTPKRTAPVRGPGSGRPPIGPMVKIRMTPEMIEDIDKACDAVDSELQRKPSRAEWVRKAVAMRLETGE